MGSVEWGPELAAVFDDVYAHKEEIEELGPMVERLAELAAGGPALEFAIGTGRVGLPLSRMDIAVTGIELSPHMVERMRTKPGADAVPVTIGDMTTTRVPGEFRLVYLVANTLMNVTTQDEQVAVFQNAAAHLEPGGCFVLELIVPQPSPGPRVFTLEPDHVGIETFDDMTTAQIASSHHWMVVNGELVRHSAAYRYVWPAELDLMARLAGLRLTRRWSGWKGEPFTPTSVSQVVVYEKP